jgi:hypothetical protein
MFAVLDMCGLQPSALADYERRVGMVPNKIELYT